MRDNQKLNACVAVFMFGSIMSGFAQSPLLVYGQLRAIMHHGDLSPKVLLDTLSLKPTTFGLGVAAGLKGEIIVVYGEVYSSSIREGMIETKTGNDVKAAMLVMANAESPIGEFEIDGANSLVHLADIIALNLDHTSRGTGELGFLIQTENADVNYHIIDWKDTEVHTAENHKRYAKTGQLKGEKVTIVGFFSEKGAGVFTPHTSKIHLHVYSDSKGIVGHVDDIKINSTVVIKYY